MDQLLLLNKNCHNNNRLCAIYTPICVYGLKAIILLSCVIEIKYWISSLNFLFSSYKVLLLSFFSKKKEEKKKYYYHPMPEIIHPSKEQSHYCPVILLSNQVLPSIVRC